MTPNWTRDEIEMLLHFVSVPDSGTMDYRLDYAMRQMTSPECNFPIRPMFEYRKKYYEYVSKNQTIKTMTAKEAKEKSEQFLFNITDGQYEEIMKKIASASDKGEFEVDHYGSLHEFTIERLKGDGFAVREYSSLPRGEIVTTINWF